jgi:hypothetical protein
VTDPLAGLADIELPVAGWPEAFAALAIGLLVALLASALLRLVAWRPPSPKDKLLAELMESRSLDPGSRLLRQAQILRQVSPGAMPDLSASLYRRSPQLSPDDVEQRLIKIILSFPHPEARAKRASKGREPWHGGASRRDPSRPAARAPQGEEVL